MTSHGLASFHVSARLRIRERTHCVEPIGSRSVSVPVGRDFSHRDIRPSFPIHVGLTSEEKRT